MSVTWGFNKFEPVAEDLSKTVSIVANNRQAAASFWTVRCEGSHDRMPVRLQGLGEARYISRAVALFVQEVESRSVMPNVIGPGRLPHCDVGHHPVGVMCSGAKAGFGSQEGCFGQV